MGTEAAAEGSLEASLFDATAVTLTAVAGRMPSIVQDWPADVQD